MGRRGRVAAGIVVLGLVAGLAGPAPAQTRPAPLLTPDDVGFGSCRPAEIWIGQTATCRFPLLRDGVLDPRRGPYLASYETPAGRTGTSQPCRVEGTEIVCRRLSPVVEPGRFPVEVRFGGRSSGPVAEIGFREGAGGPLTLRFNPPVVLAGVPRAVPVEERFEFDRSSGVVVEIRDERTDEVIERVRVKAPNETFDLVIDPETGAQTPGFELTIDRRGPVAIGVCLGDDAATCAPTGFREYVDVVGPPLEVVVDHNVPGADRIDLVLAGVGFASVGDFAVLVPGLLGLEGPIGLDGLGQPAQTGATSLVYGPFAVEPIRSAMERFNLWILPDLLTDPNAVSGIFPILAAAGFGLNAVQATAVVSSRNGEGLIDTAEPTTFDGEDRLPDPNRDRFGSVFLYPQERSPLQAAATLTHELGHALFALRDEYVDLSGRFTLRFAFPNCASSETEALGWWGDHLDEVDPFYDEWVDDRVSAGLPVTTPPDDVRVGLVHGGCYSPGPEAVRPTVDSLMNSGIPVFGAANRARAEEILASFSGLRVVDPLEPGFAELVGLGCVPAVVDPGDVVTCSGEFPAYSRPPEGVLLLRIGPSSEGTCTPADPDAPASDPVSFGCEPIEVEGSGGTLAVAAGVRAPGSDVVGLADTGVTIEVRPPATTSTTAPPTSTTTTVPQSTSTANADSRSDAAPSSSGGATGWVPIAVLGGLGVLLVLLAVLVTRRRSSGR